MTDASHLPLALYKANLELWLRIGQLLEDNRGQWMDLLAHELDRRVAGTRAATGRDRPGRDWPSMAMLPGSELWRLAERQIGDLQALARTASGNQVAFVDGFRQALQQWQEATAAAFGAAAGDAAIPAQPFDGLRETLERLSSALLSGMGGAAPAAGAGPHRDAAGAAPAKRPARRTPARKAPAPAKRASARTAAKKAAKPAARKTAARKTAARRTAKKTAATTAKRTARRTPAR